MRRMILTGAALLLTVTACGQQESEPDMPEGETEQSPGEQSAPAAPEGSEGPTGEGGSDGSAEEAHVFNHHGDENGFEDQRPTEYVATEFTTFSDMEWEEWSDQVARGEGEILGTWCMDQGCQDDPYDVEIELSDPVEVDGTTYFSTYTITDYDDDMSEETRRALEEADGGRLAVPAAE